MILSGFIVTLVIYLHSLFIYLENVLLVNYMLLSWPLADADERASKTTLIKK